MSAVGAGPARVQVGKKRRRRRFAVGRQVPLKSFAAWSDAKPGHFEADLVGRSGGSMPGIMIDNPVLTEVASGSTESVALLHRERSLVVAGLDDLQQRVPIGIHGVDRDRDSVFIHKTVLAYCREKQIEFPRSRPHRKNDQAWIEQKNGAVVRRFVGYRRYQVRLAAWVLGRLY